jgi:hypothetical protein
MFIRLPQRTLQNRFDCDGAHPEAVGGVGADDVDERHRGLHEDPVGERRVVGRRVQVPVEGVVPHEPGCRVMPGEQLVDGVHHVVAVEGPDGAEAGAGAAHLLQLAVVAVEAAGEAAARHEVGELLGRLQEVRPGPGGARGRVEHDGVEHEHVLGVRGEMQVDSLSDASLASGP